MSQLDLFNNPARLTREEAMALLAPYLGQDLREQANLLGVTQQEIPPKNSGWVGHTVEWLLGQPPNNNQAPDFGSWELKTLTVRPRPNTQIWSPSGALVLTQFHPRQLADLNFEESHLYAKVQKLLLACHEPCDSSGHGARMVRLCAYDLEGEMLHAVSTEYQALQWAVRTHGVMGLQDLSTRLLGAQVDGVHWRFIARQRWVEEMIS